MPTDGRDGVGVEIVTFGGGIMSGKVLGRAARLMVRFGERIPEGTGVDIDVCDEGCIWMPIGGGGSGLDRLLPMAEDMDVT